MSFTGMLSALVHDIVQVSSQNSFLFGGWSLGGNLAIEMSRLFCVNALHVPACFSLDPRGMPPFIYRGALTSSHERSVMSEQFMRLGLDVKDVSTLGPRMHWLYLLQHRIARNHLMFQSPMSQSDADVWSSMFQADAAVVARSTLLTATFSVTAFESTDHFTLGQDHAWDVVHRLRHGALGRSSAA